MFESIIKQSKTTDYDFRKTANPKDPLIYLFNEWVDYYKVKWAIANTLKPTSILEIGVRFGYSAAAFLAGYSDAYYLGIDADIETSGGVKGAINWAKKITQPFTAEFMIADTQVMNCFPGGIYDLIHVDGQQTGDSSFHDLELAINQAYYILVDGYFWSRPNFLAVSDFLFRYKHVIDFYGVIPGYAGDLLIKVSADYLLTQNRKEHSFAFNSSSAIRQAYTLEYYNHNCSFEAYNKNQGKILADPKLQAVTAITSLKKQGCVLDIGCGRGDLTYYFAYQGFKVTAIDYSQTAIDLAQNCFKGEEHLKAKVQFFCDDVCTVPLKEQYDLAVASDIIEHLSSGEVDSLYKKVANHLLEDGLFVLHTFPNLWYYQYEYPRRRKIAASVGAYLPIQPRTNYEILMHINEQSPRVMKRQLSKYFKNVLIWFGDSWNPGGSLLTKFSKQQMRTATDLFAIASHQPINQEQLKALFRMEPLPPIPAGKLNLVVTKHPFIVKVNTEFNVDLEITNYTNSIINSYLPNPIQISYHWLDEKATKSIVMAAGRSRIFPPLSPLEQINYKVRVKALDKQGKYVLRMTLVQEFVRWFDQKPEQLIYDISILIK